MSLTKVRELSAQKLQGNYGIGVSLTLVVMLTYLGVNLIGKIASMFLSTVMLDFNITKDFTLDDIVGAVVTLCLSLIMLSPLRLNIKRFYQKIQGESLPATVAFSYFSSLKQYLLALHFCVIRFIAVFLSFLLPMVPSIIIAAILATAFDLGETAVGPAFGALFILMVVLFAMGLVFSIYYIIGFFYTDYIYIKGIQRNPFKALALSRKTAKENRQSLFYALITNLPYYLLCLCLVTIPFLVPKIRANFAVYTEEILWQFNHK
ncbi:MAG: hypothetical protein RR444_07190 [Oscillospiraceae bacterium]